MSAPGDECIASAEDAGPDKRPEQGSEPSAEPAGGECAGGRPGRSPGRGQRGCPQPGLLFGRGACRGA